MKETFYEETCGVLNVKKEKKLYNIFSVLQYLCYVLVGGIAIVFFFYVAPILFFNDILTIILILVLGIIIPIILLLTLSVFFLIRKTKHNLEFDYTVCEGYISVDKVINGTSRKSITEFSAKEIEKIGLYESEKSNEYLQNIGVKKQKFSNNDTPTENKNFYYFIINKNGTKNYYLFECTTVFIKNVLNYTRNPQMIFSDKL